jgi:hypothetical protein
MEISELLPTLTATDAALQREAQAADSEKARRQWLRERAQGYVAGMTHVVDEFTGFVAAVAPKKSKGTKNANTRVVLARNQTLPKLGTGTALAVVSPFSAKGGLAKYDDLRSVNKVAVAFLFLSAGKAVSFADAEIYDVANVRARTETSLGYLQPFEGVFDGILGTAQGIVNNAQRQSIGTLELLYAAARDVRLNEEFAARLSQRMPIPVSGPPGV